MEKRFFTAIWALLSLNMLLLGVLAVARQSPPIKSVNIAPRLDGILVYGENRLGLRSMLYFPTWTEASVYFKSEGLELPSLSYAEQNQTDHVSIEEVPFGGFKLKWISNNSPNVLFTPDAASAQVFAQYLKFQRLSASTLGYSLSVGN